MCMANDGRGNGTDGTGDGDDAPSNPARYGRAGPSTGASPDGGATADSVARSPNERYCSSCGAVIADRAELCPECGVRQGDDASGDTASSAGEPSSRYLSAFAGSVVSFFVGWVPIVGPLAGGAVAGYLRGSDTRESAVSGLIANVLAAIPMMALAALFLLLGGIGAASEGGSDVALGLFLWAVIFAGSFVYFFVLGAVGGALGAALTSRRSP